MTPNQIVGLAHNSCSHCNSGNK